MTDLDPEESSWLIVIVAGVCGAALFAVLLGLAMDAEACTKRGGVYARSLAWSGYECVRRGP
jgi:hypothetical protein